MQYGIPEVSRARTTYRGMPGLGDSTRHRGHTLPMALDKRYDVPVFMEKRSLLVFLLAHLQQIRDRRYAHLRECCRNKRWKTRQRRFNGETVYIQYSVYSLHRKIDFYNNSTVD